MQSCHVSEESRIGEKENINKTEDLIIKRTIHRESCEERKLNYKELKEVVINDDVPEIMATRNVKLIHSRLTRSTFCGKKNRSSNLKVHCDQRP